MRPLAVRLRTIGLINVSANAVRERTYAVTMAPAIKIISTADNVRSATPRPT